MLGPLRRNDRVETKYGPGVVVSRHHDGYSVRLLAGNGQPRRLSFEAILGPPKEIQQTIVWVLTQNDWTRGVTTNAKLASRWKHADGHNGSHEFILDNEAYEKLLVSVIEEQEKQNET